MRAAPWLGWAILLCATGPAAAQGARQALRIAPAKLYPEIVRMAEQSEWAKLDRATEILAPLLTEIDAAGLGTPGQLLRAQVMARNGPAVIQALEQLAVAGVADLIRQARSEADAAARRELVRAGFSEFLTVRPILPSTQFRLGQEIELEFRTLHALAGIPGDQFATRTSHLLALLQRVSSGGDRPR